MSSISAWLTSGHWFPNSKVDLTKVNIVKAGATACSNPPTADIVWFNVPDTLFTIGETKLTVPLPATKTLSNLTNILDNIVNTLTGKATAGAPNAVGIGIAFITLVTLLTEVITPSTFSPVVCIVANGVCKSINADLSLFEFSTTLLNAALALSIAFVAESILFGEIGGMLQTFSGVNNELGSGKSPLSTAIGSKGKAAGSIPALSNTVKDSLTNLSFNWVTDFWTLSESLIIWTTCFPINFSKPIIYFYLL